MEKQLTTVIFVRHAQSLHPYSDERTRPLTEVGMKDRHIVEETLKSRNIDAFFSSPYKRSVDTIRPAAELFGMDIKTDERFRERDNGVNEPGLVEKRWADFDFAEEGGESLGAVQRRNIETLNEILIAYAGKTVVIGTHGTALSTIMNYYDPGYVLENYRRVMYWMPNILEFSFDGKRLLEIRELAHIDRT